MKWMLMLLLILTPHSLSAATPYSQTQCDSLKQQKEQIRKRLNTGYSFAEGEQLDKRDRELFQQIAAHCISPIANAAASDDAPSDEADDDQQTYWNTSAATSKYAGLSLQELPSWSARNAIFNGDKMAAWTEFYQVPRQCRQKQLSVTEFVQCADDKAQQKRVFEQRWHSLTFVPLTADTAQAKATKAQQPALQSIAAYTVETAPAAAPPVTAPSSRYVENIQQQFHWVGIAILVLLTIGGWLIWRS
jgi:hypothetical protein